VSSSADRTLSSAWRRSSSAALSENLLDAEVEPRARLAMLEPSTAARICVDRLELAPRSAIRSATASAASEE
jgi:hypothetical protein